PVTHLVCGSSATKALKFLVKASGDGTGKLDAAQVARVQVARVRYRARKACSRRLDFAMFKTQDLRPLFKVPFFQAPL
ncbi:MAG: hypothetical protein ABIQ36_13185, partial [Rhodanobacter sp.]